MFDFLESVFDTVVDVVEFTGRTAVDIVGFTLETVGEVADFGLDVAGTVVDTGIDIVGEVLGPLFNDNYHGERYQQAESRYQRRLDELQHNSRQAVKHYADSAQHHYSQHLWDSQQQLSKEQKRLRHLAFEHLHAERATVRQFIGQLKPRKKQLKAQLEHCAGKTEKQQLKAEIRAINAALNPLYEQLALIKQQFDELHNKDHQA
jgi:hypothetical protein